MAETMQHFAKGTVVGVELFSAGGQQSCSDAAPGVQYTLRPDICTRTAASKMKASRLKLPTPDGLGTASTGGANGNAAFYYDAETKAAVFYRRPNLWQYLS